MTMTSDRRTYPRERGRFLVMRYGPRVCFAPARWVSVAGRTNDRQYALRLAKLLTSDGIVSCWVARAGHPATLPKVKRFPKVKR